MSALGLGIVALAGLAGWWLTLSRRGALEATLAALALAALAVFVHPPMTESTRNRTVVLDTTEGATPDPQQALRRLPEAGRIDVRGQGLPAPAWDERPELPIRFRPAPQPEGLWLAHPQRTLAPGQAMTLDGRVHGPGGPGWQVRLLGPGGVVAATAPVGPEGFRLTVVPRATGPQRFRLQALDERERVRFEETLPVIVTGPADLAVRMDLTRASFEANALRRWLEATGARMQVHTRLSRGIVRSEGVGVDSGSPTAALEGLNAIDLLVLDGAGFAALDGPDADRLTAAMDDGLGVLVLASPEVLEMPSDRWAGWSWTDTAGRPTSSVHGGRLAVQREPVGLPNDAAGVLLAADDGTPLVVAMRRGQGVLALSVMNDSHAWRTGTEGQAYGQIWSDILSAVVRPQARRHWFEPATSMATVGERLTVCRDDGGCQTVYPEEAGWLRPSDDGSAVYVFSRDDWPATRAWHAARATRLAEHRALSGEVPPLVRPMLDGTLRYLLALLALGALWLIGKLRSAPGP